MTEEYNEFIGTYSDDILFLEAARKALLTHPFKRTIPEWCDASTARLYAVTMVGAIDTWLEDQRRRGGIGGVLDAWFSPKMQNGARVKGLFRAFMKAGIGVDKNILRDFLAIKYLRNTIVHAKWKDYEAAWVKRRGFPDNTSRLSRKHLRRMVEVFRTMMCYTTGAGKLFATSSNRLSKVRRLGTIKVQDDDLL